MTTLAERYDLIVRSSRVRRKLRAIGDLRPETIQGGAVTVDAGRQTIPEVCREAERIMRELEDRAA